MSWLILPAYEARLTSSLKDIRVNTTVWGKGPMAHTIYVQSRHSPVLYSETRTPHEGTQHTVIYKTGLLVYESLG